MNAPADSLRDVYQHMENLERHNCEMKEMLTLIYRRVSSSDPYVWYPEPKEVTQLAKLAGGLHAKTKIPNVR